MSYRPHAPLTLLRRAASLALGDGGEEAGLYKLVVGGPGLGFDLEFR
jgi:hypothetical protein